MDEPPIPQGWRFDQVRADVERGRLWKARDRLTGRLLEDPTDEAVLEVLGWVCFRMGDLPQAGRYWWLTERDDEAATAARDAFYERFGTNPGGVLAALPRPMPPDRYPPSVEGRLEDLVAAAKAEGLAWEPWRYRAAPPAAQVDDETSSGRGCVIAILAAFATLVVLASIGLVVIIAWIFGSMGGG